MMSFKTSFYMALALLPVAARAATFTPIYSLANTTDVPSVAFFAPSVALYGTTQCRELRPKRFDLSADSASVGHQLDIRAALSFP